MSKIDKGHQALDQIVARAGALALQDANEAETRLKVIDTVLRDVLGWQLDDISVEERVSEDGKTTFLDYKLSTAAVSILVEAKKIGEAFFLPNKATSLKLGGVLSEGAVGEACRQVRDYCRKKSVQFAVATNGLEWIIFPAVRTDGVTYEDTQAKLFRSLDDVKSRFVEFWELLSRERVAEGNLESLFFGNRTDEKIQRSVRMSLPEPGYRLGRNSLYEHIEPAVSAALEDEALLSDKDALSMCYVKTSERVKYDTRLKMYIQDSKPPLAHTSTRISHKDKSNPFQRQIGANPKSPQKFIVLLGPVGAGKSTFLNYTRRVSSESAISGKIAWAQIDFKKATVEDEVRSFIYRELRDYIENDKEFDLGDWDKSILPAYKNEADNLKRGALKPIATANPQAFNEKLSAIILAEREAFEPYVDKILTNSANFRPTYIVLDNVDQIENLDFQAEVFVEAQALARRARSNIIISLRETTYLKHKNKPIFDAFQFESFYIEPPSVPPVLSRRFSYAKRVLAGVSVNISTESGIRLTIPDLGDFFEIVSRSLLSETTGHMLDSLAGGDIRRGLQLVREFLASGHTDADGAVSAYLTEGNYRFPRHEVFRGAVLGSRRYYDDAQSLLPNLYDAKLGARNLQLLRFNISSRLLSGATQIGFEGLLADELYQSMSLMGVAEGDVETVLEKLFDTRLIRTTDGLQVKSGSRLFPTRLTGYLIRSAMCDFTYSEFCSIDSVIFDDECWNRMSQVTREIEGETNRFKKIELRARRLDLFMDYMKRAEDYWIVEANRRKLDPLWSMAIIKDQLIPAVKASCDRVVESARRRYSDTPKRPSWKKPGAATRRK